MTTVREFNSNFYVVAATVIPVYFLALILPSGILYRYWHAAELLHNRLVAASAGSTTKRVRIALLYALTLIPPFCVIASESFGETGALMSLYRKNVFLIVRVPEIIWVVWLPGMAALGVMSMVAYETVPARKNE
jgi:hypothetical protein